jgi:sugar fermentation stimulation protein A
MLFPLPLLQGRLIRRYKRFLADVHLDTIGDTTVHCPNPGAMMGLDETGSDVWVSPATGAGRKLPYTLEIVRAPAEQGGALVGVNTGHPNRIAAEAIAAGAFPTLSGYASIRREVRYGRNSRIDLLLEADGRPPAYVEVKNVHLRRGSSTIAEFPDCVTTRGAKHLDELAGMVAAGARAVMVYVVQRDDCDRFAVAADIDPAYAAGLARATAEGVEAICIGCAVSTQGIVVVRTLPVLLPALAKGRLA